MANYSTVTRVRDETGFTNNTNIADAVIQGYLDQATGVVKSWASMRYDLNAFAVNFTGSQGEQVLKRVEEMLASGWLLVKEYGADAEGGDKGGYKKLEKIAMTMLDAIAKGEMRLLDTNNQEFTVLTKNPSAGVAGYTAPPPSQPDPTFSDGKFSVDMLF